MSLFINHKMPFRYFIHSSLIYLISLSGNVHAQCTTAELGEDVNRNENHFFLKKTQGGCNTSKNYYSKVTTDGRNRPTLDNFKTANGYNPSKAITAQYYNNGDLGFGRSMVCWSNDSYPTNDNTAINHLACYVGNHGVVGSNGKDQFKALNSAKLGHKPFATVAMEFNRNATTPTTFFAYDANGNSVTQVELDSEGPKYIPGACTVCHSGTSATNGTLTGVNFLPFDYNTFKYLDGKNVVSATTANKNNPDIKTQLAAIKNLNKLVRNQQMGNADPQITGLIDTVLYPAPAKVEKLTYDDSDPATAIAERFCRGCHIAHTNQPYNNIKALAQVLVCNGAINATSAMPHAELNAAHAHDFAKEKGYCTPTQHKFVPKPKDPATPVVSVSTFNGEGVALVERVFRAAGTSTNARPTKFNVNASGQIMERSTLFTNETAPWLSSKQLANTAWTLDAVGNFNGDTINDLLWRNYRTGEIKVYYINSSFAAPSVANLTNVPVNFKIIATGNFNGNGGHTDILWLDENTGSYFMQDINNIHTPSPSEALTIDNKVFNNTTTAKHFDFVGVGNFGGDARAEILLRANKLAGALHGNLYAIAINSTPVTSESKQIVNPADDNWYVAAIGDMNNDNFDDVIFKNIVTSEVWYYRIANYVKQAEGYVSANGQNKVPNDWVLVGAAKQKDNQDNPLILVWRNIVKVRDGNVDKAHFATWTLKNGSPIATETISLVAE